jgi:hypothetical protein
MEEVPQIYDIASFPSDTSVLVFHIPWLQVHSAIPIRGGVSLLHVDLEKV